MKLSLKNGIFLDIRVSYGHFNSEEGKTGAPVLFNGKTMRIPIFIEALP